MHSASTQAYISGVGDVVPPPGDVYEIESDNLKRPVFEWVKKEEEEGIEIEPGRRRTIEVRCLGKIGW